MSRTKPVRIYLDTQDFNNLGGKSPEYKAVLEFLLTAIQNSSIEIGYSYPLVFEIFRKYDDKHREQRLKLARLMKRLCGKNAFPHFVDMRAGARFPNDGLWMPRSVLGVFSPQRLKNQFSSAIRSSIQEDKRITGFLKRTLKSNSGIRELVQTIPQKALTRDDFPGLPVTQEFLDGNYLYKYLAGTISSAFLSRKMTEWLSDPEAFIQLWYEYSAKENPLESMIADGNNKIQAGLSKFLAASERFRDARKRSKEATARAHKILHESNLPGGLKESLRELIPSGPASTSLPRFDLGLDEKFGKGRSKHFDHYLNALFDRKIEMAPSDLGDLLHLIYLQDVDLMRCDRKMANLMRSCPDIDHGKIVDRLVDLPAAVEARLAQL